MRSNNQEEHTHAASATETPRHIVPAWVATFWPGSLVGRQLAISTLFIATIVVVAWAAQLHVTRVARSNTDNLASRYDVSRQLLQLSNSLWEVETGFQNYMLVGDAKVRDRVSKNISALHSSTRQFAQLQWLRDNPATMESAHLLGENTGKLLVAVNDTMTMRADPLLVFPAMPILVRDLNPRHQEFLGAATVGLEEAAQAPDDPAQRRVHQLLEDVRYMWAQRINAFRMLITSRMGLYNVSLESGMTAAINDIEVYDAIVTKKLDALNAMDRAGDLTFLQSDALREMLRLRDTWNADYARVHRIHVSNDAWRRDVPAIRDETGPLFAAMWKGLRGIETELEQYAAGDVEHALDVASDVSRTLWLIAVFGLLIAAAGAALFEFQMRRPLAHVAAALKNEADGRSLDPLPRPTTAETAQLVSAFTQMRAQIRARQERLEAIMHFAAEAIVVVDDTGNIESLNPAAELLFGYGRSDITGHSIASLVPAIEHELLSRELTGFAAFATDRLIGRLYQERGRRKDGLAVPISLRVSEMHIEGQRMFLAIVEDDRERHAMLDQLRAREQRLQTILDNTAEAIVTFDHTGQIEGWNKAAERVFGWTESEIRGAPISSLVAAISADPGAIAELSGRETETTGLRKSGDHVPLALKLSRLEIDGRQKFTALIANISERKAMVENLRTRAERDGLTGLFNRSYFYNELERATQEVQRGTRGTCALLYIDLDNFKFVNDTLGHAAGDKVIVEVSALLNRRVRKHDLVARLGGDEFVVLIYDTGAEQIAPVAESFRKHLAEYNLKHEGQVVDLGCSIGIAVIDASIASVSDAMAQADLACHLAKRQGRNRVHLFTTADQKDVQSMSLDMGWSRRIKNAIEHDGFVLMCQPIVHTKTHRIAKYEILVRMRDDQGGLIMPSGFLPTAERFGLMAYVDHWIVRHAIELLGRIHKRDANVAFAINLSAQTLTPPVAQLIAETIARCGVDPAKLTFEITETTAIAEMDAAVAVLTRLNDIGCGTALDDFGSGMASFAYLRELPVTMVKIDGRFVRNLGDSAVDGVMIQAMNEIAHALGRETIAEFVENADQHAVLSELGVDYCQGYYFSKPFPAETLESNDNGTRMAPVVDISDRVRSTR